MLLWSLSSTVQLVWLVTFVCLLFFFYFCYILYWPKPFHLTQGDFKGLSTLRQLLHLNCCLFLCKTCFPYILLTKREGSTGRISAWSLDSRDQGQIFSQYGPEQAWLIRVITRLKKANTAKTQVRDHSRQCPVQDLEDIGPAIEHFDWLILVIGSLTARVMYYSNYMYCSPQSKDYRI